MNEMYNTNCKCNLTDVPVTKGYYLDFGDP